MNVNHAESADDGDRCNGWACFQYNNVSDPGMNNSGYTQYVPSTTTIPSASLSSNATRPSEQGPTSDTPSLSYGDATSSLAKELSQLGVDERNKVMEEIHGVDTLVDEDATFIQTRLERMKFEIDILRERVGQENQKEVEDYNRACFLAPTMYSYKYNKKFYLMFLRSTKYDPKAAGRKLVTHFRMKAQLFGPDKVGKEITLEDLDEDDTAALKSGYHLFLPTKDSAGRAVCLITSKYANFKTSESQLRVNWCNIMSALQDESVQQRGQVIIFYEVGRSLGQVKHLNRSSSYSAYQDALPMNVQSIHFCYSDSTLQGVISIILHFLNKRNRIRFRDHCGGHLECHYALESFGIPSSHLSIDQEGTMREDIVELHLEKLRVHEAKIKDDGITNVVATNSDVLLGRGKPFQDHPGNIGLAKIIEEWQPEFHDAEKFQKTVITWQIVKTIHEEVGGRFLEKDQDTGKWRVCTNEAARAKVAYGFRARSRLQRRSGEGKNDEAGNSTKASTTTTALLTPKSLAMMSQQALVIQKKNRLHYHGSSDLIRSQDKRQKVSYEHW